VTKDPVRPFIVMAAGVAVRAVGTAFNVKLDSTAVEVLVTEGMVAVATEDRRWTTDDGGQRAEVSGQKSEVSGDGTGERKRAADEKGGLAVAPVVSASGFRPLTSDLRPLTSGVFVSAGQRAVVPLEAAGGPPKVSTPPPEEVARRLAWQPRLLTFTDEPLSEILAAFNRHNPVALRLDDPALAELRLSVRFRSDNVPGFLRLLESEFRVRAQQQSAGEIVLRAAQ
jgi:transmembrane sensor